MSERSQIGQMSESWGIEGKSATVIESWHFFLQYVEKHFQVKEIQAFARTCAAAVKPLDIQ